MSLTLNVITASTRPGRIGPTIASWIAGAAAEHGRFDVVNADLAEFALPILDEAAHPRLRHYEHDHTKAWSASVDAADAFVFVTPEYNHFPPASLVNALQIVAGEWGYKPAGIVSYGGVSGGLRGAQELRMLLDAVNVHAIPQSVPIPAFPQFIEDGTFAPTEPMAAGATLMLDELHRWAEALAPMRG